MLAVAFYESPQALFFMGLVLLVLFAWYFATDLERRKRNVGTALLIGVTLVCLIAMFPLKERLKGGIDILGGSSFSLRVQPRESTTGETEPITKQQVEQAIKVIEGRLNSMGTADSVIAAQGGDRILVQMPGVAPEDSKKIRATLEKVAKLELRKVHPQNPQLADAVESGDALPPPGYKLYTETFTDDDGKVHSKPILLGSAALGGSDVSRATPSQRQLDAVDIKLNSAGGSKMLALTQQMRPGQDRLAVVLDDEVICAPTVNGVLASEFVITGLERPGETREVADALMNPLENGLLVEEERSVSPLLGAAIVQQGIVSGIVGLAFTFLFVLIYYRVAGFVAICGLILNSLMLFGIMAMFGFTFTLPGIAGIVLTIGVAVDANVLINERLREELANGKSLKNAISAAYDKAFSAIFDANITSLITAVILFWIASSTIKGFAVTLTIGLVCSMFSAILATRVLFRWGVDLGILKKLSFLHLIKSTNFDFMGKRVACVSISAVLTLIAIGAFFVRGERSLGVDFTGGTRIEFLTGDVAIPTKEAEEIINQGGLQKQAFAQNEVNPTSGNLLTVRADIRDADTVIERLREHFPALGEKVTTNGVETYKISASRAEVSSLVGSSFLWSSAAALGLGLLGIFIYVAFRFEFGFAVGAFVATVHDCIVAAGFVVLLGQELSLIHVGAILTIAGYSLNDTIIIFDRIRENLNNRVGGHSVIEVMNEAINATLSRTILTSTATIVSLLSLAILGGAALRDFSIIILIGIFIGTYSSIFVASPFVLWWNRGRNNLLPDDGIGGDLIEEVKPATH
jgi:SecD/SecF fusion protein